jgi:hypothetical protein
LKTVDCNRSMSSNPIASAIFGTDKALIIQGFVVSGVLKNFRLAECVP